ncbi:hypothetical protein LCGC14_0442080 [marine sediment metagenome]|uniref:Uncharacterized protein n=1 Tax=marine sediment metagenome TaxID=412755 RepID=A0A0F9VUE6_9ZZZZ
MEDETPELKKFAKPEMVELSVVINDLMNYTIKIPREITTANFGEIMKRLKAVQGMLPKEATLEFKKGISPLLQLGLEETEELYALYQKSTPESFSEYIKEKYNVEEDRNKVISLMGRLKKKIYNLTVRKEKEAAKNV